MKRSIPPLLCSLAFALPAPARQPADAPSPDVVQIADARLQIGLDRGTGAIRELIAPNDGFNQVAPGATPFSLWRFTIADDAGTTREIAAETAPPPNIERIASPRPGLRLVWDAVAAGPIAPLRVEAAVQLDGGSAPLSHWTLSVSKPAGTRIRQVRFPRVGPLRERPDETLALPRQLGVLARNPRALARGKDGKGTRLSWTYLQRVDLSLQCLAFYQEDGPGFYAAGEDPDGHRKEFALWSDAAGRLDFEMTHEPEQEALGLPVFRLPYTIALGAFRGDWSTAAQLYRESPSARAIAARGRLARNLTPDWVNATGLWLWNRGRSPGVLDPARALRKHLDAPVSILWHWWHNCPYDAGFPEYLPPREGAAPFKAALEAARREDVRAILYMNQRLWGTRTRSWAGEQAERYAVKGPDGAVRTEVYNVFMKAPCAPMCIATGFWRDRYAGLARAVLCDLRADGVYMDQTGVGASCYDPTHGHIIGPGRYWTDGLAALAAEIRDRTSRRGPVALGGEFAGEPWIGSIDINLGLSVAPDRFSANPAWEPIPFYPAVYHPSAIVFGNMAGLAHPPYDEKWPPDLAPPGGLTPLDRKFTSQFLLEQARTFVWGMQPMLANFLPAQFDGNREEIDFVTRLVRTRRAAMKYLLRGTWVRPPRLDAPRREIDVARVGTYTPLQASKRTVAGALAGAWRAPDGDVGVALASIDERPLTFSLPIDAAGWGLDQGAALWRIDHSGRHSLGPFDRSNPVVCVDLPPRAICILEFCRAR